MTPPPTDSSTGAVAAPAAPAGAAGASCEVAAVGARDAAMPPFRSVEAWTNDTIIAANIPIGGAPPRDSEERAVEENICKAIG